MILESLKASTTFKNQKHKFPITINRNIVNKLPFAGSNFAFLFHIAYFTYELLCFLDKTLLCTYIFKRKKPCSASKMKQIIHKVTSSQGKRIDM